MGPGLTRLDARLRRLPDWLLFCAAVALLAALTAPSLTEDGRAAHVTDFFLLPVAATAWLTRSRLYVYLIVALTLATSVTVSRLAGASLGATAVAGVARLLLYGIVVAVLSALRNERAAILRAAAVDHHTGTANARAFEAAARRELERSRRYGHPLALVYLDIDDFKHVNDSFGHSEGDRVLEAVAGVLRACVRSIDVVGRLGGDEFAVLMPEADREAALTVAGRVRDAVQAVTTPDGAGVHFSIGVAAFAEPAASVDEMLREADRLMYVAKRGGKDRVESVPPDDARSAATRPRSDDRPDRRLRAS